MNIDELKKKAKKNNPKALYDLAYYFLEDENGERDENQGNRYLKKAIQKGYHEAFFLDGFLKLQREEYTEAIKTLLRGVKKKSHDCNIALGKIYIGNIDTDIEKNDALAIKYFKNAFHMKPDIAASFLLELDVVNLDKDIKFIKRLIKYGTDKKLDGVHLLKAKNLLNQKNYENSLEDIVDNLIKDLSNGVAEAGLILFEIFSSEINKYKKVPLTLKDNKVAAKFYKHYYNFVITSELSEDTVKYKLPIDKLFVHDNVVSASEYTSYAVDYIKKSIAYEDDFTEWIDDDKFRFNIKFNLDTISQYHGYVDYQRKHTEFFDYSYQTTTNAAVVDQSGETVGSIDVPHTAVETSSYDWNESKSEYVQSEQSYNDFIGESKFVLCLGMLLEIMNLKDTIPMFGYYEEDTAIKSRLKRDAIKNSNSKENDHSFDTNIDVEYCYSLKPIGTCELKYDHTKYITNLDLTNEMNLVLPEGPLEKRAKRKIYGALRQFSIVLGLHKMITVLIIAPVLIALIYTGLLDLFRTESFVDLVIYVIVVVVIGLLVLAVSYGFSRIFKREGISKQELLVMYDNTEFKPMKKVAMLYLKLSVRLGFVLLSVSGAVFFLSFEHKDIIIEVLPWLANYI